MKFALKVCKDNNVAVFFVKNRHDIISHSRELFAELGVTVVCEDESIIDTFKSKDLVYQILKSMKYDKIPKYIIANSVEDFVVAYGTLTNQGETVCVKFNSDEGAKSFRIVTNEFLRYRILSEPEIFENKLTFENMKATLTNISENEEFKPLMVMPILKSPEISIDCYNSRQAGFVAIPRFKMGSRIKMIKVDSELKEDCLKLQRLFNFKSAFNVQYRWDRDEKPRLLEINTRMSGGIHISTMAGFSIPNQIVADILDIQLKQSIDDLKNCMVTQYENPIKL